jgi:hypothetical protein
MWPKQWYKLCMPTFHFSYPTPWGLIYSIVHLLKILNFFCNYIWKVISIWLIQLFISCYKMQQMSNMWPTKKALMGVVQWQMIMSLLEKLVFIFSQAQKLIDESKPYNLLYAMCFFSSTKWHHSSATLYCPLYCPFGNYPSTQLLHPCMHGVHLFTYSQINTTPR